MDSDIDRKIKRNDSVRILEDKDTVRRLQEGHGPWNDTVSRVCKSPLHTSPTHSVFFSPLSTQSLPPSFPNLPTKLLGRRRSSVRGRWRPDLSVPTTTPNDITTYPTPSLLIQPPLVSTPTPCTTVQLPNCTTPQPYQISITQSCVDFQSHGDVGVFFVHKLVRSVTFAF